MLTWNITAFRVFNKAFVTTCTTANQFFPHSLYALDFWLSVNSRPLRVSISYNNLDLGFKQSGRLEPAVVVTKECGGSGIPLTVDRDAATGEVGRYVAQT